MTFEEKIEKARKGDLDTKDPRELLGCRGKRTRKLRIWQRRGLPRRITMVSILNLVLYITTMIN